MAEPIKRLLGPCTRWAATFWILLGVGVLVCLVGQVRALVWGDNWHFDGGFFSVAYQLIVYVMTPLGCLLALGMVVRTEEPPEGKDWDARVLRWLERRGRHLDWLMGEKAQRHVRGQWLLFGVLLVSGVGLMLAVRGPIAGRIGTLPAIGIFVVLAGWFLPRVREIVRRTIPEKDIQWQTLSFTVGRAVTMGFIGMMLSEVNWWVIGWCDLPYRLYSYIGVMFVAFVALLVARVTDAAHHCGMPAVRLVLGALALALLVVWPAGVKIGSEVEADETTAAATPSGTDPWFDALQARVDTLDPDAPAVVVAASGGGSRAALFASLVYTELGELDLHSAVEGDFERSMADQVVLISSVSGGSLASAYFASPPEEASRRQTSTLFAALDEDARARLSDLAEAPFPRAMAMDFMAPLLHGVLTVGQERGVAVSLFWEREFGWAGKTNVAWSNGDVRPPTVLFNATDAATGRRTVLGFPRLPPGFLHPYGRSVSELDPPLSISLAEAVRVSANFPWGFDLAAFHGTDGSLELTDGGVIDNTGLDTLAAVFRRLESAACDAEDPHHVAAADLLAELLRRGIVLVEIDAGARPGEPGFIARSMPAVMGPAHALQRASHVNAGMLRGRYLSAIREAFERGRKCLARDADEWAGSPVHVGFVRAGLTCEHEVMTAWALGTDDIVEVLEGFDMARQRLREHAVAVIRGVDLVHRPLREAGSGKGERDAAIRAAGALADYSEQVQDDDERRRAAGDECTEPPVDDPGRRELRDRVMEAGGKGRDLVAVVDWGDPEGGSGGDGDDGEGDDDGGAGSGKSADAVIEPIGGTDGGAVALDKWVDAVAPEVAVPKPERDGECGERRAWVYLGEFDEGAWTRRYFDVKTAPRRLVGRRLRSRGTSMLRRGPPSDDGEIARALGVLGRGRVVCVERVQRWLGGTFVWARVRYG